MIHVEAGTLAAAGNQLGGLNDFFRLRAVQQEGVKTDGFMSKAAAARLFPCEVLVIEGDIESGSGQLLATHGPGGASANDRDIFHSNLSSPQGNRGAGRRNGV